jgi:GDP-L-fucose synthase
MDVSRLAAMGWQAKTGLREGIAETYQWYLANAAELRSA